MNNNYPKVFLLSVVLSGFIFCLITLLFKTLGILSFNDLDTTMPLIAGLPIAIILLQFIIPALGLILYRFLNNRFPNNRLEKFSLSLSNLILGICVAMLFFGYLKWYTLVTFLILFVLLLYIEYKNKLRFMYRFYRTYAASLLPFYLLSVFIKNQGKLLFNQNASLKLNLASIPIEAYFYFMGMLLVTIYLFELFKSRGEKTNG